MKSYKQKILNIYPDAYIRAISLPIRFYFRPEKKYKQQRGYTYDNIGQSIILWVVSINNQEISASHKNEKHAWKLGWTVVQNRVAEKLSQ